MKRIVLMGALAAFSVLPAVAAQAAPPNGFVVTFSCDDGQSYDVNFGAPKNQSSVGFIVGTNDVLVAKHFEIVFEGEIVFSFDRGIEGFEGQDLLTCSGEDPESGTVFNLTGYITPR